MVLYGTVWYGTIVRYHIVYCIQYLMYRRTVPYHTIGPMPVCHVPRFQDSPVCDLTKPRSQTHRILGKIDVWGYVIILVGNELCKLIHMLI